MGSSGLAGSAAMLSLRGGTFGGTSETSGALINVLSFGGVGRPPPPFAMLPLKDW